jgi:SEC-C motif-containing protein
MFPVNRSGPIATCPCGSGKGFEICCGALIAGKSATTAEALMRSRYTAFVIGDIDYLQNTSGGEALLRFDRSELQRSLPETEWRGLEIVDVHGGQAKDTTGTVKFKVSFRQGGQLHIQTERSEFRRIDRVWRYCRGEVDLKTRQTPAAPLGRNDPCSCGSGKKYKKCCGV